MENKLRRVLVTQDIITFAKSFCAAGVELWLAHWEAVGNVEKVECSFLANLATNSSNHVLSCPAEHLDPSFPPMDCIDGIDSPRFERGQT